jgi:hypothetical protein
MILIILSMYVWFSLFLLNYHGLGSGNFNHLITHPPCVGPKPPLMSGVQQNRNEIGFELDHLLWFILNCHYVEKHKLLASGIIIV